MWKLLNIFKIITQSIRNKVRNTSKLSKSPSIRPMSFIKNKLLTIVVALGISVSFSQARYSKINLQDTMDDYRDAFKTKHFDFELESEASTDLFTSPVVGEPEPEPIQMSQ